MMLHLFFAAADVFENVRCSIVSDFLLQRAGRLAVKENKIVRMVSKLATSPSENPIKINEKCDRRTVGVTNPTRNSHQSKKEQ